MKRVVCLDEGTQRVPESDPGQDRLFRELGRELVHRRLQEPAFIQYPVILMNTKKASRY